MRDTHHPSDLQNLLPKNTAQDQHRPNHQHALHADRRPMQIPLPTVWVTVTVITVTVITTVIETTAMARTRLLKAEVAAEDLEETARVVENPRNLLNNLRGPPGPVRGWDPQENKRLEIYQIQDQN